MNLSLPDSRYDMPLKRATFYKSLTERLETLPGVRSAGAVMFLPLRVSILSFRIGVNSFVIQGRPPVPQDQRPQADYRSATPGYFSTMGIALRQGRLLDPHDDGGGGVDVDARLVGHALRCNGYRSAGVCWRAVVADCGFRSGELCSRAQGDEDRSVGSAEIRMSCACGHPARPLPSLATGGVKAVL